MKDGNNEELFHITYIIQRTLDFDQAEREGRFVVKPGLDHDLDDCKHICFDALSLLYSIFKKINSYLFVFYTFFFRFLFFNIQIYVSLSYPSFLHIIFSISTFFFFNSKYKIFLIVLALVPSTPCFTVNKELEF